MMVSRAALPAGDSLAQPNASIAQRDDSGSQDRYRRWAEIFERSRAVGDSADTLPRSEMQPAKQSRNARPNENVSARNIDVREPDRELRILQRIVAPAEAARDVCSPPLLMSEVEPTSAMSLRLATGIVCMPHETAEIDVPVPSYAFVSERDSREPMHESVLVLEQGESVCVIVRNAQLSEDLARRAAFATARALKGHGAALQSLMLNGCTIFQQRVEQPHSRLIYSA